MKTRFNSFDVTRIVAELKKLIGLRVNQVYDIDNKTYLIKFQSGDIKSVLLIESGSRLHTTSFEWPKNLAPSGFSMKLRKHLKNKRLEVIEQLGFDRIVNLQFGTGEAAYHVIVELFDKGNILLTDYQWTILNLLRPHTERDRFKFSVKETYPLERAKETSDFITLERLTEILNNSKEGEQIKKVLIPHLQYGPSLIEHSIIKAGFSRNCKLNKEFKLNEISKLHDGLKIAHEILLNFQSNSAKGYIIEKKRTKLEGDDLLTYIEFHPFLYAQYEKEIYKEFESFDIAVDEFYSNIESQKIEIKALQIENEAVRKVEKIREDQADRVAELSLKQEKDRRKGELIIANADIVKSALKTIRTALASQLSWSDINNLVAEATKLNDPVASIIKELKLSINYITLELTDPYEENNVIYLVDIDLNLSAHANAKQYYDSKKMAAVKQQKTLESQKGALKSAERKVKEVLKDVKTMTSISKVRKTFWFEKFYWFISSENYLIIGGRDQQQNDVIVKKYLKAGDLYVHAELHGASSVVIKNPTGNPVPPKTLNEAGVMAVCYSVGWDHKIMSDAWWVYSHQVSKTAPTGEYLGVGSFMIRGQKNYLLPQQLAMGFGFMFYLEEGSVFRHSEERIIRLIDDDKEIDEIPECSLEEEIVEEVDSDESESAFPDTKVDLNELRINSEKNNLNIRHSVNEGEQIILYNQNITKKPDVSQQQQNIETAKQDDPNKFKRGQKSKLKKIKKKYKDQDEEEKEIRMAILQSDGPKKEPKKKKKGSKEENVKKNNPKVTPKSVHMQTSENTMELEDDHDDTEDPITLADLNQIDRLTGQPQLEDELLFAVPICAPYNTLVNYKFKVKITPGTTKRGKATRTSCDIFLRSKECTPREKDLIKNVNDQTLARNLPGKVKLFAPQLNKNKKN